MYAISINFRAQCILPYGARHRLLNSTKTGPHFKLSVNIRQILNFAAKVENSTSFIS